MSQVLEDKELERVEEEQRELNPGRRWTLLWRIYLGRGQRTEDRSNPLM